MGRVVLNHSTHIEGLIPILKRVARSSVVETITPGVITRVRSNSEKLDIRVTRKTISGFKMICRKGKLAQEIYIVCKVSKEELMKILREELI